MEAFQPKSAVILGTGYIGMETADALTRKGLAVTVLARSGRVLKTVCAGHGTELTRWKSSYQVFAEPKVRKRTRASLRGGV